MAAPGIALSTDLDDPAAVPYFLWDEPMTTAALRQRLSTAPAPERLRLLGKVLREARDTDVWRLPSPDEVARLWPELRRLLFQRGSESAVVDLVVERVRVPLNLLGDGYGVPGGSADASL